MHTLAPQPYRQTLTALRCASGLYWIGLFTATHLPYLGTGYGHPFSVMQMDKVGHVVLFGLLAWMLSMARPLGVHRPWTWNASAGCLLALVYAPFDEWTQQLTGRTVSIMDIMASIAGIMCVYIMITLPRHQPNMKTNPLSRWAALLLWGAVMGVLVWLLLSPAGQQWLVEQWADSSSRRDGLVWLRRLGIFAATLCLWHARPLGTAWPRINAGLTLLVMGLAGPMLEWMRPQATGTMPRATFVYHFEQGFIAAVTMLVLVTAVRYVRHHHRVTPPMGVLLRTTPHDERTDTLAAADKADASASSPGFVRAAHLVAVMTLLSRITGLVRDAVLASFFGLSAVADAFAIGFQVPNLFRRLFGEGALSAAFIPHYTKLKEQQPQLARKFVTACLGLLVIGLVGLTLLIEAGLLVAYFALPHEGKVTWALELTILMLPYMPLICLVALLSGVMHVHQKFGIPAAAPLVLNVMMIVFALLARGYMEADATHAMTALSQQRMIALWVGVGVLLAGAIQFAWLFVSVWRVAGPSMQWQGTWAPLRSMLAMMAPMLIGLGIFQINAFLDSLIAFGLSPAQGGDPNATMNWFGYQIAYPIEVGGAAALQWAQRLYQFPLGVFGIAIATAIFPAMATAVAQRVNRVRNAHLPATDAFGNILRQGLRLTVFIGLPASVGLILMREPITQLVYQRGEFTAADTVRVASVLGFYSASIWAYSMMHVLTRAFYAQHDSKTPLRISVCMVVLNLALNMTLIWWLGVMGLACSTAITAVCQVVLLTVKVRRYTDEPVVDKAVLQSWGKSVVLAGLMGLSVWLPLLSLDTQTMAYLQATIVTLGLCAMGAGVYLFAAWQWESEELGWLLRGK